MKKLVLLLVGLFLTACTPYHSFVFTDQTGVDQGTGLVWAKNAHMPNKPLPWKADDNVYSFIQKLNAENYAGYSDWRVPTKKEMEDLIAYAKSLGYDEKKMNTWPFLKLRQIGFINVKDYDYWTSTREDQDQLWIADLATGRIVPKTQTKPYCLWPVRGVGKE